MQRLGGVTRVRQASNPEPYELSSLVVGTQHCNNEDHFFSSFLQLQYPHVRRRRVVVVIQRSKLHTDSADVPVLHTPVEVAEVK